MKIAKFLRTAFLQNMSGGCLCHLFNFFSFSGNVKKFFFAPKWIRNASTLWLENWAECRNKLYLSHTTKVLAELETVAQRCSVKKVFLEISQNLQENTCASISFLIKLQVSTCNFVKKETLSQVFFCEFCEIFENTLSYRMSPVDASVKRILISSIDH